MPHHSSGLLQPFWPYKGSRWLRVETDAPYELSTGSQACWFKVFFHEGPGCRLDSLSGLYNEYEIWKAKRDKAINHCAKHSNTLEANELRDLIEKILYYSPAQAKESNAYVIDSLIYSSDASDFIKRIVIPPACVKNRIPFKRVENSPTTSTPPHYAPEIIDLAKMSKAEKEESIATSIKKGVSVGIRVDLGKYSSNWEIGSFHAVIATGLRWNSYYHRCEVQLRNSWGEGAVFNGWYRLSEIVDSSVKTFSIRRN